MKKQSYEDYKYVMVDTSYMYLGAKYTYDELVENEDVPFKLRIVLERYILPEVSGDTTLESHFYNLTRDLAYKTYKQLKIKLKVSRRVTKKNLFGKTTGKYITENVTLDDFMKLSEEEKKENEVLIQEVVFSKLRLLSFAV